MADFGDQHRLAEFLRTIHQTRIWLDSNFVDENLSPKLVAAVVTPEGVLAALPPRSSIWSNIDFFF